MKAVLCKEFGPPESLVIEDLPAPPLEKGKVRIEVHSAGVNFPDVLIIQNKYQVKPPLPFSPGGEISGIIKEVADEVSTFKVGDRVLASTGFGGMAEEVVVDASRVFPIPDEMDFDTAAALMMTYGTSYYALKDRAKIQPGELLLVLGAAGGVGLAAVELGKALGARVIAAASTQEKLQVAMDHGAEIGFVYPAGALDRDQQKALSEKIKDLTDGRGADVIYDPVGGDYAEPALRATNWEGRYLVIGFAAGDIPRVPLNLALLKGCQIVGVFWGAFTAREPERNRAQIAELMNLYVEGKIKPHVSETYPLSKAAEAIRDMADRKVKGKVVVSIR